MYSRPIKYIIAISSYFPIFFVFWLVDLLNARKELHFYLSLGSGAEFIQGTKIFMVQYGLLLIFFFLLLVCYKVIGFAQTHLSPQAIDVKAIKPADVNLVSAILSYVAPFFKFYLDSGHDYIYALGYFILVAAVGSVTSKAYHYNLTFSIFFQYRHFEVSTTKEVTYLVLSRKRLINKKQLTTIVHLTDYMLIESLTKISDDQ